MTTQPTRRLIRAGFSLRNAKRTAREQTATILLPNCPTREGTGRTYAVPIGEKGPIYRDFLVRYEPRTYTLRRVTKPLLYC
jgi:hypothetical protein